MTEEFEDGDDLVRVRAQVMARDDSTGGWVPEGAGGLSTVSIRKTVLSTDPSLPIENRLEYLILGKRISDQSVNLRCNVKKDFEYNKVMPAFHHWKSGNLKFGLTFQTAADARAFDKGVRLALQELIMGEKKNKTRKSEEVMLILPPPSGIHGVNPCRNPEGDDEVFMALELPLDRVESRCSSDSAAKKPPPPPPPDPPVLPVQPAPPVPESYSYVQLTSMHEYMYPIVEGEGSLKKRAQNPDNQKERCRHCQEPFSNETNVRGSCPYAPDRVKTAIECVACLGFARRMLEEEPCECGVAWGRHWLVLALLSLLVPCLWCYPPLRACHLCGTSCGVCGGRHRS